ncbi:MAG TPA: CHAT domain-containing protein [Pyrinomonadaceae bacterium]|nr:CHAT domain-containing protein [Pyrinomonadaceae bacterium]
MSDRGREYIDFSLGLSDLSDDGGGSFRVTVLHSPVGESEQPAIVPYKPEELSDALDALEQKSVEPDELFELGARLAALLLPPGQVRDLFLRALDRAGRDGGVRLRLVIREPRLAQLPWEYAYLQTHGGERSRRHFLCLNPQVSVVRHEALAEEHPKLTGATPGELRVVAATADAGGQYKLKLKAERKVIEKAVGGADSGGVKVTLQSFVEHATRDKLAQALLTKADLFHFAGHGLFDEDGDDGAGGRRGSGYVVLAVDEGGDEPYMLPAGELAAMLQAANVRVILLGACETGRRGGVSPWTGVAPAIVERGAPAVVAMQYEIEDDAAIGFSKMFYTSLAAGLSLDEAVTAGRLEMERESADDGVEWGVPVLYMRSPDGVIFPELREQATQAAARVRGLIEQRIGVLKDGATATGAQGQTDKDILQDVKVVSGKGTKLIGQDNT